jgi:hypothetical protein
LQIGTVVGLVAGIGSELAERLVGRTARQAQAVER